MEERKTTMEYFTENELWSVLYSCALGLEGIYGEGNSYEGVRSDRVYISKEGLVKVAEPWLLSQEVNIVEWGQQGKHVYLSPEQI